MDALVVQAMQRWPNVPSVYGWLRLDRRGRWRIRGEPVLHAPTAAFIGRNYLADGSGRWYFQNGPQRVFVDLDACPWVLRLDGTAASSLALRTHADRPVSAPRSAWLTTEGSLLVEFESGVGIVDDRDLATVCAGARDGPGVPLDEAGWSALSAADAHLPIGEHVLPLASLGSIPPAARFGFDPQPRPDPGEDACT